MTERLDVLTEEGLEKEILELGKKKEEIAKIERLVTLDKSFKEELQNLQNEAKERENHIRQMEIALEDAKRKEESERVRAEEEARRKQMPIWDRLKTADAELVSQAKAFVEAFDKQFARFEIADRESRIARRLFSEIAGENPQFCLLEYESASLGFSGMGEGGVITHLQKIIWQLRKDLERYVTDFNHLGSDFAENKLGYKVNLPSLAEKKQWSPGG
jgi:hypothetical protein